MSTAVERLVKLARADDRHDIPYRDVEQAQVEAANELFQSRRGSIPLLNNRAETAGITEVRSVTDLVPLLFAHTTYKSYAESWLAEGRWDRMSKWLSTVSTHPVENIDLDGISGIDDWLKRLEPAGHYLTCSSGTTGKPAMLSCSQCDLDLSGLHLTQAFAWGTGITPRGDYKMVGLAPPSNIVRVNAIRDAMLDTFASRDTYFQFVGEPITVGQVSAMITLRRKIADGTAPPAEVAAFEQISSKRQAAMDAGMAGVADELINSRGQKLIVAGMWASLYKAAADVRARGMSGKDFSPENALFVAGGLKGAQLPPDYKEFICETFNVAPRRVAHFYSMQEINTTFPMCSAGRYHIQPWVIMIPLDEGGDTLLDASKGEIEARAAFFDISLDGRWGGVISGDKISVDFAKCACGHQGPTVGASITRFSDLASGDKINCSGTIDAYVRGVS